MDDDSASMPSSDDVDAFVEWVLTLTTWGAAWDLLAAKADEGDFRFLGDVVIAAQERQRTDNDLPASLGSVSDHARMLLASSPTGAAAVEYPRTAVAASDRRLAHDAGSVASQQPLAVAVQSFAGPADTERAHRFRELLAQELLLRNPGSDRDPTLAAWFASDRPPDPLQWLPPVLADFERDAPLREYDGRGSSWSIPFGPVCSVTSNVAPTARPHRPLPWRPQAEDPERAACLVAPFDDFWKTEVRTVSFDAPVGSDDIPDALLSLGMDALAGVEFGPSLWCTEVTTHEVWEQLFGASATGAAYGSGWGGGIARSVAAKGLAALMGLDADAPFAAIEGSVAEFSWFRFDAQSDWYEQVAWDSGVACLAGDRRHLAVVAASDTD